MSPSWCRFFYALRSGAPPFSTTAVGRFQRLSLLLGIYHPNDEKVPEKVSGLFLSVAIAGALAYKSLRLIEKWPL